jgi:hypothetical protein
LKVGGSSVFFYALIHELSAEKLLSQSCQMPNLDWGFANLEKHSQAFMDKVGHS